MSNKKHWYKYISFAASLVLTVPLIASQSDAFQKSLETKTNGTSLNGTSLNGTSLNGTSLNGTSLNGNALNTNKANSYVSQDIVRLEGGQLVIESQP